MIIKKGLPYKKLVSITNADDSPYDLTGKTVFFTLKNKWDYADNDIDALIMQDITVHEDPAGGLFYLELSVEQTNIAAGEEKYKADYKIYRDSVRVDMNTEIILVTILDVVTKRRS